MPRGLSARRVRARAQPVTEPTAPDGSLVACGECDLLQRIPTDGRRGTVACVRCGAVLRRSTTHGTDRTLALVLAAVPLLVLANSFPLLEVELGGRSSATTLIETAFALQSQGLSLVAVLVMTTTLGVPVLYLAALLYLLLPIRLGRRPRHFGRVFRAICVIRPWGMVEVFLLGLLVSLVKLASMAAVVTGIALWSFAGLMIVLAAASAGFDTQALWDEADAIGGTP